MIYDQIVEDQEVLGQRKRWAQGWVRRNCRPVRAKQDNEEMPQVKEEIIPNLRQNQKLKFALGQFRSSS